MAATGNRTWQVQLAPATRNSRAFCWFAELKSSLMSLFMAFLTWYIVTIVMFKKFRHEMFPKMGKKIHCFHRAKKLASAAILSSRLTKYHIFGSNVFNLVQHCLRLCYFSVRLRSYLASMCAKFESRHWHQRKFYGEVWSFTRHSQIPGSLIQDTRELSMEKLDNPRTQLFTTLTRLKQLILVQHFVEFPGRLSCWTDPQFQGKQTFCDVMVLYSQGATEPRKKRKKVLGENNRIQFHVPQLVPHTSVVISGTHGNYIALLPKFVWK